MTTHYWSIKTSESTASTTIDPFDAETAVTAATDMLVFDAAKYTYTSNKVSGITEISASEIIVEESGSDVVLTYDANGDGATTGEFGITLADVSLSQLTSSTSTTQGVIRFNDESKLLIGTTSTTKGDTLTGWFGNDHLMGLAGNDTLKGGAGDDVLNGGTGTDNMTGGAGDDTYYVDSTSDVVTELTGQGTADEIRSEVSYTLTSIYVENLTLLDGSGNINGTGNASANTITGNDGNNKLDGKTVSGVTDILVGGEGNDTYVVPATGSGTVTITETGASTGDVVESARTFDLSTDTTGVENLTLTGTGNINGTGTAGVNTIVGNTGNNKLDGGALADTLQGGAGNDTYVYTSGDSITDTSGTDTVETAVDNYTLTTGLENLTLTAATATKSTGNSLANVIDANDGAFANVLLRGEAGNDTYYVDSGDTVAEDANEGTDTVITEVSFTLGANIENITILAGSGGSITATGSPGTSNNILTDSTTASEANTLVGGGGNDTYYVVGTGDTITEGSSQGTDIINWYAAAASTFDMSTKASNVENFNITKNASGTHVALNVTGNDSNNAINGNDAANTILGGNGGDTITGAGGGDTLKGEAGNDSLNGGTGDDSLTGGAGNDTLILGSGDIDTVVFESSGDNNGADTISNFSRGANGDILDFNAFLGGTINLHSTTAADDSSTANTTVAGEVLLVNDTGTALTTTTVAALISDDAATGTSPFEDDVADNGADQYVIISAATTGSARIWYIDSSLDSDNTDISLSDVKLVGTLSGVNDFATLSFHADNILA